MLPTLTVAAILSVWWWRMTELRGVGDLRPYLLLQGLPLVLVPLWQAWADRPTAERRAFGTAIVLYVAAKLAELGDSPIRAVTTVVSGHTVKHVLATLAAFCIVANVVTSRSADPRGRGDRSST